MGTREIMMKAISFIGGILVGTAVMFYFSTRADIQAALELQYIKGGVDAALSLGCEQTLVKAKVVQSGKQEKEK